MSVPTDSFHVFQARPLAVHANSVHGTCGLASVAKRAGVSAMTVSRVLHNSPHVSGATRERVLAAVRALDYSPDPHMARLMGLVRGKRKRKGRVVLALVRDDLPEDELHGGAYHYMRVEDVRARAGRHGCEVEEFWLGRGGFRPGRVQQILEARGVEGVLVSVQSSRKFGAELDYSKFAAATFGYGLTEPALHRASTNMMQGILGAMRGLEARGYRRIGVAISEWVDARADHTYSGAVLHYQQGVPARRRVPLLLFPHNALERDEAVFCRWMKRWRPDALISFHGAVPAWLAGVLKLRIPDDVGLVVHDWVAGMEDWAGIDHRRSHVAAAAVDLVATQLVQNERGVPEVPRQILIPPRFVDGPSIRAAR